MEVWEITDKYELSFGYGGICLYASYEIENAQIGYATDLDHGNLCTGTPGSWRSNWIVVGRETCNGDPIFIATSSPNTSVFTAMHGAGAWEPELISKSFLGFMEIVNRLETLSTGREHPVALESKPMTQKEYDEFLQFARKEGELASTVFWALIAADEEAGIEQ